MRFKRQGTVRPTSVNRRQGRQIECLETRQLLSGGAGPFSYYLPTPNGLSSSSSGNPSVTPLILPIGSSPRTLSALNNEGRTLSGVDRAGDQWFLQLHGPGSMIVTDSTPNDGVLDDQIDTIQLFGTSPTQSYLTGQVIPSARVATTGTITFQHLIDLNGIKSISLNGFTLIPSTNANQSAIYLPQGVGSLYFHQIDNTSDLGTAYQPINIVIGNPTSPLKVAPSVRVDTIQNTVFDSTQATPPAGPQLVPTVSITVNGQLQNFNVVSITSQPVEPAFQFEFPTVGVTGRTAIQATSVGNLQVVGSANNFTLSRSSFPFENGFSGVKHIKSAVFGGPADAVGLDSRGPIGNLTFLRGLGNPSGVNGSPSQFGTPPGRTGYPADGLLGGFVTSSRIGKLTVGPNNLVGQYSQNPRLIQLYRHGYINYATRPGNALTNALIVSQGSIGKTTIVGNAFQTEIKSGFSYQSFLAGLEPTRGPSHIGPIRYRGDLINSVISASYRPGGRTYGSPTSQIGVGSIKGNFTGILYNTGQPTTLNQLGTGFYARHKKGYLPPPSRPTRVNSVLVV